MIPRISVERIFADEPVSTVSYTHLDVYKRQDYYCITGGDTVLALTIADNSYMGLESVSLIDLGTRWQHTRSFMRLMPLGRTGLPSASGQGSVAVERPGYALRFDNDGMRRELIVRVDDFREHKLSLIHI